MSDKDRTYKDHGFSTAFERMCSIVAIGKTKGVEETLKELMLHCIVYLPDNKFIKSNDFTYTIKGLFGLEIAIPDVDFAIERLLINGILIKTEVGQLVLPETVQKSIRDNIDASYALENKIRVSWQSEIANVSTDLDLQQMWAALKDISLTLSNAMVSKLSHY